MLLRVRRSESKRAPRLGDNLNGATLAAGLADLRGGVG